MAVVVDISYNYTIQNSQNNYNKIKHPCPNCCFSLESAIIFCVGLYLITFVFSFLIGDLYFANSYISCQSTRLSIGLTLGKWLEVSGFTCFLLVFLVIKWFYLFICNQDPDYYTIGIGVSYSIFSLAWLIIGCLIYWNYIKPSNICDPQIIKYMELRIWFGLISVFLPLGFCFGSWLYFKCTKLF